MRRLLPVLLFVFLLGVACADGGNGGNGGDGRGESPSAPGKSPTAPEEAFICGDGPGLGAASPADLFEPKEGPFKLTLNEENPTLKQEYEAVASQRAEYVGSGTTVYVYVHQFASPDDACAALQQIGEDLLKEGYTEVDEVPVGTSEAEPRGPATQLESKQGEVALLWRDGDLVVDVRDIFSGNPGFALELIGYLTPWGPVVEASSSST